MCVCACMRVCVWSNNNHRKLTIYWYTIEFTQLNSVVFEANVCLYSGSIFEGYLGWADKKVIRSVKQVKDHHPTVSKCFDPFPAEEIVLLLLQFSYKICFKESISLPKSAHFGNWSTKECTESVKSRKTSHGILLTNGKYFATDAIMTF